MSPTEDQQQTAILSSELEAARRRLAEMARRVSETETELERTRSECDRLAGLAALGEAAVQLNHDINNPLCSISLNVQLLLMNLADRLEESTLDKLRSIEANTDRIRVLTEGIAAIKRSATAAPEISTGCIV